MFVYVGKIERVQYAAKLANALMSKSEVFKNKIVAIESFDMTEPDRIDGQLVWDLMQETFENHNVMVKIYYPWYRFSKALGYFTTSRPFDINLNGYRINRSPQSLVATLIHELVHMADNTSSVYFGHGDNSKVGKELTAPYLIGSLAAQQLGDVNDLDDIATYKKRESFCRKLKKLIV